MPIKTNKLLGLVLVSVIYSSLLAQEIRIGNKVQLESQILDEKRELWISLPASYSDSVYAPASYPVLYLLDPEYYFQSMVAIREALTGGLYNYMPEMIIVGIANTDRSRDMTPTNSFVMHSGKKIHETSGGAYRFLSYIKEEVIAYIDSVYRTNDYRILNGHSFGGLFSLYVLQEQPQLFNSYIVHDPSIWWDEKALYKSILPKWDALDLQGRCLFLSMAHNEEKEKDRFEHTQTINLFNEDIIKAKPKNGFRYHIQYYEKEDHGTIFLPASYDAMRYIYKGICLPVKKIPVQPGLLEQHYKMVSDSINYTVIPSEKLVNEIVNYCIRREEFLNAEKLLQLNIANYPQSANAHLSLGNLYVKMNKPGLAEKEFQITKSLNPLLIIPGTAE